MDVKHKNNECVGIDITSCLVYLLGRLGSIILGLPSMFGAFGMFGPVYQMSSFC